MKYTKILIALISIMIMAGCAQQLQDTSQPTNTQEPLYSESGTPFEDAYAFIEFNAGDEDYGFHVEVDEGAWGEFKIISPDGGMVFEVNNYASMTEQGLTTLLFESAEFPISELSREDFFARFPAGEYIFAGKNLEGDSLMSKVMLTHNIPDAPVITSPEEDEVVSLDDDVLIKWEPVTSPAGIEIDVYWLNLYPEDPEPGQPPIDLNIDLTLEVPGDVTELPVSAELLEPGAEYIIEIYAKEMSGNVVYSESAFLTE